MENLPLFVDFKGIESYKKNYLEEVSFIGKFADKDHVAHVSQVEVEEGNQVRIVSGELMGYEG